VCERVGVARLAAAAESAEAMRARRTRTPFRMENAPAPAFDEVICIAAKTCAFSHEERAPIIPRKIRVNLGIGTKSRATLLLFLAWKYRCPAPNCLKFIPRPENNPLPAPHFLEEDKKLLGRPRKIAAEGEKIRAKIMK
jgi:hypothetical protein